jgi:hypothetical protein
MPAEFTRKRKTPSDGNCLVDARASTVSLKDSVVNSAGFLDMAGLFGFVWTGLSYIGLFGPFLQIDRSSLSGATSDDLHVRTTDSDLIVKIHLIIMQNVNLKLFFTLC